MTTIQYTLRNVPEPVNRYLRAKAQLTGKSLNQVIIDELADKVAMPEAPAGKAFARFIGIGIDETTLHELAAEDRVQKSLTAKELAADQ